MEDSQNTVHNDIKESIQDVKEETKNLKSAISRKIEKNTEDLKISISNNLEAETGEIKSTFLGIVRV